VGRSPDETRSVNPSSPRIAKIVTPNPFEGECPHKNGGENPKGEPKKPPRLGKTHTKPEKVGRGAPLS